MSKEKLEALRELIEKKDFYLNTLNGMHDRGYKEHTVESALEDTITKIADEMADIIVEMFLEDIGLDIRDGDFDEQYESFTAGIDIFVRHINSYEKYGARLSYPVPVGYFEIIMDDLLLDFEWVYPCYSDESMVKILWNSELYD